MRYVCLNEPAHAALPRAFVCTHCVQNTALLAPVLKKHRFAWVDPAFANQPVPVGHSMSLTAAQRRRRSVYFRSIEQVRPLYGAGGGASVCTSF